MKVSAHRWGLTNKARQPRCIDALVLCATLRKTFCSSAVLEIVHGPLHPLRPSVGLLGDGEDRSATSYNPCFHLFRRVEDEVEGLRPRADRLAANSDRQSRSNSGMVQEEFGEGSC